MSEPSTDLAERARAWAAQDPDHATRAELEALLTRAQDGDEAAAVDLADRFTTRLAFGTAGLRGALGAGPARMNRVVVIQTAAGLAAHLREQGAADGDAVVVGYDARHLSDVFAADTAAVLAGAGLRALVLPGPLPTPVLAFAIRDLGCVAGVMVTASHNPPADNGYKVYLGDGSQIVPPSDEQIAAHIDRVAAAPLADVVRAGPGDDLVETLADDVVERYLDGVAALVGPADGALAQARRQLRTVYTPLHGVGGDAVAQVLRRAGFAAPVEVAAQSAPDPDFPTVDFPNPEEPGALDLALAAAAETDADLVLANDPDADRCAAAVPGARGWRMLRGDEVGALLADHLLRSGTAGAYATTIVSSTLLARLADEHEQPFVETLTGFKWLGRVEGLAFAYEEALGYCVAPGLVRDKDGVSALLLLADLAARLRTQDRTLVDALDDLAMRHGLHATDQLSVRVDDLARIDAVLARLREDPPATLGGLAVTRLEDLSDADRERDLPPTPGLRLTLESHARVVVRPSGTELKLKCYLEVVLDVEQPGADSGHETVRDAVDAARIAAAGRLDAVRSDLAAAAGI